MSGRLDGRRILVVGGGTRRSDDADAPMGNGRAIAVRASADGARVAITDLDESAASATARLCEEFAVATACDVRDADQATRAVGWAVDQLGGLDGVVCNVGVGAGYGFAGTDAAQWDEVFAINVRSHFLTLRAALEVMGEGSSSVLVTSVAALKPGSNIPAYDASKAAQLGLMRAAAKDAARRGGRVNALAPGLIDTPLGRVATQGRPSRGRTPVPLGRQGTAEEVAAVATFLLSDEASYVTGQLICVDGGLSTLM